jgi:TolB-like protein/DNA-binding winged helix-turn-helix (wHTH) protein
MLYFAHEEGPVAGVVYQFEDFTLDSGRFELRRKGHIIRLERKPMELLILLVSQKGQLVTRTEIAERLWHSEVFVDTEHGINTAIGKIRSALRDDPEQPRFVQTVTGKGYRIVCLLEVSDSPTGQPEPPVSHETGDAAPNLQSFKARSRLKWVFFSLVVIAVLAVAGRLVQRRWRAPEPVHSLAVLPLENLSGDPSQEYFADGMTDELITELARIPGLRVVSRTSVMQEKGPRKPLSQIARELNVDALVEGSVVRSGSRVRITAQLIDTRTDKHLWAQSFEGELSDILSLQDSVAREIASHTKVAIAPALETKVGDIGRMDPAAHDAYLRGLYFLQKREADTSVAYFQKATSLEPGYAPGFAGLADALHSEWVIGLAPPDQVMPAAVAAAKRAIQLDPSSGEAYAVLGSIETDYEWNWDAAERDLQRGIALSPNNASAEFFYAIFLDAVNRPEEAVAQMRRALELDPLSFLMNRHLGTTLYLARRYDEALYYLKQAREMEPGKADFVDSWISAIYEKKGMRDEAVNADLSGLRIRRPKINIDGLHSIYERDGWKAYWLARIEAMQPYAKDHCIAYQLGVGYLRVGNGDLAFPLFNKAVDERCQWMVMLKVDPLVDNIRTDKRYKELLRRIYSPK